MSCPCSSGGSSDSTSKNNSTQQQQSSLIKGNIKVANNKTNTNAVEIRRNITLTGDCLLKFCIAGIANVGKTSLCRRFVFGVINDHQRSTVGVDFFTKTLVINGDCASIQLFDLMGLDIGGAGKSKATTQFYYRGSHGILIVSDCISILQDANRALGEIESWKKDVDEKLNFAFEKPKAPVLLLINKMDIPETKAEMSLIEETANKAVNEFGFDGMFLVSAKQGSNVQEAFIDLIGKARKSGVGASSS